MEDIEIARNTQLEKITKIAEEMNIQEDQLEQYGKYKAKISPEVYKNLKDKKDGKLILVTAINPTPLGEGKTTMAIGLADGLRKTGKNAVTKVFEEACARLESDHPVSTQEMAEKIAACPLVFAPGTSWQFVGKPAAGNAAVDRTGRVYLCKFYAEMCGT